MNLKTKRLYRSRDKAQLAGVCAGVAAYLDADPTVVRLVSVGLLFVTGGVPGILTYLAACVIVPREPEPVVAPRSEPMPQPGS